MRNRAEIRVGRLLEVRAQRGYRTPADVDDIFTQIGAHAARVAGRFVLVVDWRNCPIMAPDASEILLERMKRNNARVERCATLASPDSPAAVLQFLRILRAGDNPDRRLFHAPEQAIEWLTPLLTVEEATRLRQFVSEL